MRRGHIFLWALPLADSMIFYCLLPGFSAPSANRARWRWSCALRSSLLHVIATR